MLLVSDSNYARKCFELEEKEYAVGCGLTW